MEIKVVPAKNSKTLWALVVDGETWDEGTETEMLEDAELVRKLFGGRIL